MTPDGADDLEPVEDFRHRARTWVAGNLPMLRHTPSVHDRGDAARRAVERDLQRRIWEGGFAGICFPAEYGGLGLTPAHQRTFAEESTGYDLPFSLDVPTLGILAATLIDFGTHEQKLRHLPAILRGDELWAQFLSEPSGGSDLAGVLTRADRATDGFVLNGSKIWSSGAAYSDFAMCLARTSWDVPKHAGLTMFLLPIRQAGIVVEPIRQVDGSQEFCQEHFDDVGIPEADVVGQVDDGWTVATRMLLHERVAVGGGSPYTSGHPFGHAPADLGPASVALVVEAGREDDARARQLMAEARVLQRVAAALTERVSRGVLAGRLPPASGALLKLFAGTSVMRRSEIALELAGADAAAWTNDGPDGPSPGESSLSRQAMSLGGGSNEIQRNVISERVLEMPREQAADRDVPYRDVRRGPTR